MRGVRRKDEGSQNNPSAESGIEYAMRLRASYALSSSPNFYCQQIKKLGPYFLMRELLEKCSAKCAKVLI